MRETTDIAVIGAGVVACCCLALALAGPFAKAERGRPARVVIAQYQVNRTLYFIVVKPAARFCPQALHLPLQHLPFVEYQPLMLIELQAHLHQPLIFLHG